MIMTRWQQEGDEKCFLSRLEYRSMEEFEEMGTKLPAPLNKQFFRIQAVLCQASTWMTDIMANNRIYHIMEEW